MKLEKKVRGENKHMRFINRGRRSGKTQMMISSAYITGIPIIVFTYQMKEQILKTAREMHCDIDVYTVDEFRKKRVPKYYDKILIDECESIIDLALKNYFGCNVVASTLTIPMECDQTQICEQEESREESRNE